MAFVPQEEGCIDCSGYRKMSYIQSQAKKRLLILPDLW